MIPKIYMPFIFWLEAIAASEHYCRASAILLTRLPLISAPSASREGKKHDRGLLHSYPRSSGQQGSKGEITYPHLSCANEYPLFP